MSIKVTDYIAGQLFDRGVRQVFQLSGGMITHLLDSLEVQQRIEIVSVHHEQAAAFAADASGRMTGIPGVAMATSGPGAINLLTGIGSCYFDSSPAVFITGQVNRNEQKRDSKVRQLGFQETDIVAMAAPITKAAWRVEAPEEIPDLLDRAFCIATAGRPGPVLLDIPMDVQRSLLHVPSTIGSLPNGNRSFAAEQGSVRALRYAVESANRPLVLVGGGVRASRSIEAFRQLVDTLGIPVVHSLMAVDALPFAHPLRVGMIGSYGNRWANLALSQSDLLLVLGSRLDVRQTGSNTDAFKAGRIIFHVDCEEAETNNRVKGCESILSNLADFVPRFLEEIQDQSEFLCQRYRGWSREVDALRAEWPDTDELAGVNGINPNVFMHGLSRRSHDAAVFVADVGQHQMWAAQSLELDIDQRFMTSGGMGSMGFGLPAAIGAVLSASGRPVVLIAGDGGFQCNIQELQTVVRLNLPIKIIVINNQCHGMVRQFQQSYFEGRYPGTYWGYSAPDFARIANAYGLFGLTVDDPDQVDEMLNRFWEEPSKPVLLQVMIDTFANAYPKIAFGRPINEMEPFSQPIEMEST